MRKFISDAQVNPGEGIKLRRFTSLLSTDYIEHIDFYRKGPDKIGKSASFTVEITKKGMTITGKNEKGETVEEEWMR